MTYRSGATFSDDDIYRYRLWKRWDENVLPILFLMLNPSTATPFEDDPTVARCTERARRLGFGGIEICNLFAYRATDPRALYRAQDPVGPENISEIVAASKMCDRVILGWGAHADKVQQGWSAIVVAALKDAELFTLVINGDGSPKHPLYVGYDVVPQPFVRP